MKLRLQGLDNRLPHILNATCQASVRCMTRRPSASRGRKAASARAETAGRRLARGVYVRLGDWMSEAVVAVERWIT